MTFDSNGLVCEGYTSFGASFGDERMMADFGKGNNGLYGLITLTIKGC